MAKYEEKFIVINVKKHLNVEQIKKLSGLLDEFDLPDNNYYVCNQDEPYAQKVIDIILKGEDEKLNPSPEIAEEWEEQPIHNFFELSYAQYLAIPRSVLQSMPKNWQKNFVLLLNELWDTNWLEMLPEKSLYKVELRHYRYNKNEEFCWDKRKLDDPLANYERGRRRIQLITIPKSEDK